MNISVYQAGFAIFLLIYFLLHAFDSKKLKLVYLERAKKLKWGSISIITQLDKI